MKDKIKTILADAKIPIEERIARVDRIYADAIQKATSSNHEKDEKFATLLSNYAQFLYEHAHYTEAERIYLKQIGIVEKIYGKDHKLTANAYNYIGEVYYEQGEYNKALDYFYKVLDIHEKSLDKDSPDTAKSYNSIGKVFYELGEYKKAIDFFNKALDLYDKIYGTNHPDTATSYNNIGLIYDEQGDYEKALDFFKRALDIREKVLGRDDPDTAKSYNNVGLVYYSKEDYVEALEYLYKAFEIIKHNFGEEHPYTASTYNNIGMVYKVQGDNDKALEYYFKALKIRKEVFGENHPDTATSYNNIGGIYFSIGDYDQALTYYKKAFEIRKKTLGTSHPYTANIYNNIGIIFEKNGDLDKALEYFNQALEIFKIILGDDHPQTAVTYNNIGEVYNKKGDKDKAQEFYSKSIPIIEKRLGVENAIDTSNQNKDDYHYKKGDPQQGDSYDQNTFRIIYDVTKCTSALSDVDNDFQKEMQVLADDLRKMFNCEYCAIGIVDGTMAEDYIVSLELHNDIRMQKKQTEFLESVRIVDISNKNILLCQALDQKSRNLINYKKPEEINVSETFDRYTKYIMKSGRVKNITVIPLRDEFKESIGFIQFINSKEEIDFNIISPLLPAFLGLTKTILQKSIKQRKENREKDFDFYDKIQKAKGANQLLDEIMKYLATEFKAAIVSFRIPIANAPKKNLSHFYLRSCYINERLKNHYSIKSHYQKERILIPKDEMGGYEDLRIVHKEQVIYHNVKNKSLNIRFNLDLYDKFIVLPVFRDNTTTKSQIKQLYGTFQLRLFNPTISTNKKTELISRIRFERELADAKKRLTFLSEQITLLFNSYVHRFENESLRIFQKELSNSSFVKIQDFDERCVNIIKNSVRANVCSIYRFDKAKGQLTLSATTAQTIHFNATNENFDANNNKDKCFIPITSNKNLLQKAFVTKKTTYIFDIRDTVVHQSPFIENLDKKTDESFLSAMVVPLIKKDGNCLGVVLLLGKEDSNRFISTAYWEHDISHIEFIVNALTRISESDNERMAFLSQLSHELLTPVAEMVYDNDYIISLADANPNSATKHKLIAQLKNNIDTCMLLKYLISNTEFRYTSSERNMDYNIVKQDKPLEILLGAKHLLEKEAIDKGLDIRINISEMPPMFFDSEHMMQVFINLLKNAIRYSDNDTIINIDYQNDNLGFHEICFANYGIGIQEEEKEKIFDLFYRGEEAKIKSDSGTGIGLYIVRDIMRDHGGDCFVRNLNAPTEIVITLPNK